MSNGKLILGGIEMYSSESKKWTKLEETILTM